MPISALKISSSHEFEGAHPHESKSEEKSDKRHPLRVVAGAFFIIFILLCILIAVVAAPFYSLWKQRGALPASAYAFKESIAYEPIGEVLTRYADFRNNMEVSRASYEKISGRIPFVFKDQKNKLNDTFQYASQAMVDLEPLLPQMIEVRDALGKNTFFDLPAESRLQLTRRLGEISPKLQTITRDVSLFTDAYGELPQTVRTYVFPQLPSPEALRSLRDGALFVANISALIPYLPLEGQRYLILLQNSTELKPTGGFIGTYAVATILHGKLVEFESDDVYNFDIRGRDGLPPPPPQPIRTYAGQDATYLRNINWSPDFPTTARAILEYWKAKGSAQSLSGVIALTPEAITPMLEILGPLNVYERMVTSENLVSVLEEEVEMEYWKRGIEKSRRKDLVGLLGRVLIDRISNTENATLFEIAANLTRSFATKDIQAYYSQAQAQDSLRESGWAGAVPPPGDNDVVFVVDANMEALKTDAVIKRTISYSLDATKSGVPPLATLSITYDHQGKPDWKTSRYRTYTRIYTNQGAIRSVDGNVDEQGKQTPLDVTEELGYVIFGTFTTVEPSTSRTLTFKYSLNNSALIKKLSKGAYTLHAERQAGSGTPTLNLNFHFPKSIILQDKILQSKSKKSDEFTYSYPLTQSRTFFGSE
ncbi:MAG: DUF4012 domain-containing protein [Patescibacteria group bacterium]